MEISVIGDKDSAPGFLALGLKVYIASAASQARKILKEISPKSAVIYITEDIAKDLEPELQLLNERITPSIVLIPSSRGTLGIGISGVKKSVERAVGADILFGEEGKS